MKDKLLINIMLKLFLILLTYALFFGCSHSNESSLTELESNHIKKQVLSHAENWLNSWNGKVDSEKMMATYHPKMKYAWRGNIPLGTYDETKKFAESLPEMGTNFQLTMSNINYNIIDKKNAVIFFQFDDENKSPFGVGAASLVMNKTKDGWKIIYVHESTIEPLK